MQTKQPYSLPVTVEANGRIHLDDWYTYVEIKFEQELSVPLVEALQSGKYITVTLQVCPEAR